MTADEFRREFAAANHMLWCRTMGGEKLAVGLNGDKVVFHGGDEMPLSWLKVDDDGFMLVQVKAETTLAAEMAKLDALDTDSTSPIGGQFAAGGYVSGAGFDMTHVAIVPGKDPDA